MEILTNNFFIIFLVYVSQGGKKGNILFDEMHVVTLWWLHGHTQPDDASVPLGSNPTSLAGRQGLLCYTVLSGLKFKSHVLILYTIINTTKYFCMLCMLKYCKYHKIFDLYFFLFTVKWVIILLEIFEFEEAPRLSSTR